MTEPATPLLDRAVIEDLFDHLGAEQVRPVLELFIAECRDHLGRIEDAARRRDPETVRRAAHSLKSAAGQLGAAALSQAASALESAAAGEEAALGERIAALQGCAAGTGAALKRLLSAPAPTPPCGDKSSTG